jgi:hypothetical protein
MACSVSTGSDREICNKTPKIPEPEPSLDQQLCTNRRCDEERALLAKWDMNRVAEDGLCVVCGGPERRLSALGTPEDEHLPVLSIVAAVGLEPEPPEKGPGTAKGGTKAHGLSLLVDMIRGSGGSPIGRLTSF